MIPQGSGSTPLCDLVVQKQHKKHKKHKKEHKKSHKKHKHAKKESKEKEVRAHCHAEKQRCLIGARLNA